MKRNKLLWKNLNSESSLWTVRNKIITCKIKNKYSYFNLFKPKKMELTAWQSTSDYENWPVILETELNWTYGDAKPKNWNSFFFFNKLIH